MLHRIKYRVVISCDAEIEAGSPEIAWNRLTNEIQEIVNREYAAQEAGIEDFDGILRGCTLRLPGSMLVTGIDMERGDYDRPRLKLLQGGH